MLEMSQISKVYRTELVETHALRELDLHVQEGEFVAVTGPSGSGKTTFLNIAGLLESPSSGYYRLDGEDVGALNDARRSRIRNAKVGFIFQSFNLIPDLNLADNVEVPLRYRGWSGAERRQAVDAMLERVADQGIQIAQVDVAMPQPVVRQVQPHVRHVEQPSLAGVRLHGIGQRFTGPLAGQADHADTGRVSH